MCDQVFTLREIHILLTPREEFCFCSEQEEGNWAKEEGRWTEEVTGSWIGTEEESLPGRRGLILLSECRKDNSSEQKKQKSSKKSLQLFTHLSHLVFLSGQEAPSFVAVENKMTLHHFLKCTASVALVADYK